MMVSNFQHSITSMSTSSKASTQLMTILKQTGAKARFFFHILFIWTWLLFRNKFHISLFCLSHSITVDSPEKLAILSTKTEARVFCIFIQFSIFVVIYLSRKMFTSCANHNIQTVHEICLSSWIWGSNESSNPQYSG